MSVGLRQTFTLQLFARQLACTTNGFCLFAGPFDGRLFVVLPEFHFPENTFTLQFLFQSPEGLIDIVIANLYLH